MKTNKILFMACEKAPEVRSVKYVDDAYLKKALGGDYRIIQPFADKPVALAVREIQLGSKLPLNRFLTNSDETLTTVVKGDFIMVGLEHGKMTGLEDEYVIKTWLEYYKIPTFFNNSDGSVLMNTSSHIAHRIYRHLRLHEDSDRAGIFYEDLISCGNKPLMSTYKSIYKSYLEPGSVINRLVKVRDFEIGDVLEVTSYDKDCRQQVYYFYYNGEADFERFSFDKMSTKTASLWLNRTMKDGVSMLMEDRAREELAPSEMRDIISYLDLEDCFVTDDGYVYLKVHGRGYEGVEFVPHRAFTDTEKEMSLAEMTHYFNFTWDFELGMFDETGCDPSWKRKHNYNYEGFFKAMGDGDEDIYYCVETGSYYVPCSHTMMKITRNIF